MPAPPFAQVQASIAGGGNASGGLTAAFGQTVQLSAVSTVGWTAARWEIFDFPPGFTVPAGWSTDSASGAYFFAPANPTSLPPVFTLPASGANNWGPFAFRLRINGNPLQRNADGSLNTLFVSAYTDEATFVAIPSPTGLIRGIAFGESTQYDAMRGYVGGIMQAFRVIDPMLGGGGGSPGGNNNEIQIKNGAAFAGALRVLAGTDFISIAASPSTTGSLRLAQTGSIKLNDGGVDRNAVVGAAGSITFGDATYTNAFLRGAAIQIITPGSIFSQTATWFFTDNAAATAITAAFNATGATTLTWAAGVTTLTLKQADTVTNSATGTTFTIQAQNATGTTTIGATLALSPGSGTSTNGVIDMLQGGSTVGLRFAPVAGTVATAGTIRTPQTFSLKTNDGGTDRDVIVTAAGTLTIGSTTWTNTNVRGVNPQIISTGGSIFTQTATIFFTDSAGSASITGAFSAAGATSLTWANGSTPSIVQGLTSTNSATGKTFLIQAQNATGTTSTGGQLSLTSGTGTTTYGAILLAGPVNEGRFVQAMADAPQTVSAANSANNQFVTTGANTATRALTLSRPPTAGTMVIVRNNCTGNGITVQFSSGAATATIPINTSAYIGADGTNAFIMMSGT